MIVNNTKVFPARLYGRKEKTGAKIEVFLLRELNKQNRLWDVIVDPARKIRVGNKLILEMTKDLVAEVIDEHPTSRGRTNPFPVRGKLMRSSKPCWTAWVKHPCPNISSVSLKTRTRSVTRPFTAKILKGAVAAPDSTGLHFSRELIKRLEIKGVKFAEVTLHTGLGTFRPIEVEDLSKHKMDAEYFHIDEYAVKIVNKAKEENRKICAVGTTSVRAVESSVTAQNHLKAAEGWTNTFIHPPYDFSIPNALVTNFHLPKTSLLIMVCAFAGYDLIMEAYQQAIKEKYRFFSYGDAMLIL